MDEVGVRSVAILATLDTKSGEAEYLKYAIEDQGWLAEIIDVGLEAAPGGLAAVTNEEVAAAAEATTTALREAGRRDQAMQTMGLGAGRLLEERYREGDLAGVIAVGGNQGTAIASIAMRTLPIGPPKLMISTVASGNVREYVGDSDITMMFSVGDLLGGPNPIIKRVLDKAAAAMIGMASVMAEHPDESHGRSVAVTAFGNTHNAVVNAMQRLKSAGYSVVPFHASGACGSAMERLIEQGSIEGVLDLTTHEILGEIYPEDIYAPVRPGRLSAAGNRGVPQVVAPGGLEYFCFGPPESIPERLRHRPTHHHNPYNTNVRTDAEELRQVARLVAERLNASQGPASVLIPSRGWSEVGSPDGILHDPTVNQAFTDTLREQLDASVPLQEIDATINDAAFAASAADTLLELMGAGSTAPEVKPSKTNAEDTQRQGARTHSGLLGGAQA